MSPRFFVAKFNNNKIMRAWTELIAQDIEQKNFKLHKLK